jgi:hypothetical protein
MANVDNIKGLEFMEDDYLGFDDEPFEESCPFLVDEGIGDSVEDIILSTSKHWQDVGKYPLKSKMSTQVRFPICWSFLNLKL